MSKEFKGFISFVAVIVCGILIGILWGAIFIIPAIVFFVPSLGYSWRLTRYGEYIWSRLAFMDKLVENFDSGNY